MLNTIDCENNEKPELFTCKLRATTKTTVINKASIAYSDIWYTEG